MKPKDYERWKTIGEKGRLRFFLVHGMLKVGTANAILATGIGYSATGESSVSAKILIAAVIWLVTGLIYGLGVWSISESLFKHHSRVYKEV